MKTLSFIFIAIVLNSFSYSQAPNKMSYQAVVRDVANSLVANQIVGIQISILQGSVTGSVVYLETQMPSTNSNGLISIEIGTGTVMMGNFNSINWSNGNFFIKTETDPTGGTAYSITGTSQLLSVPYALHANTADSIIGGISITELDPVFASSVANGITALDTANWNSHSIDTDTNLDSAGLTSLGFFAGPHTDSLAIVNMGFATNSSYSIGDFAHGGIVFWIDETGEHGLVCAKTSQSTNAIWHAGSFGNTQAKGNGPFSGKANTSIIIAAHVAIGDNGTLNASRLCNELQITEGGKTYGDWYLPSLDELNEMYLNKTIINATATANGGINIIDNIHWTSTEHNNTNAWGQHIGNGNQQLIPKGFTYHVRAIRAF